MEFVILGEPASKANSRRLVRINGRSAFIKSSKALGYAANFLKQCPILDPMLEGDLRVSIHVWYASRRPDLDASLILDLMQGRIFSNDRAVREQHLYASIDKENPRAAITVEPLHVPLSEGNPSGVGRCDKSRRSKAARGGLDGDE